MAQGSGKNQEISLGDDFDTAVVRGARVTVELNSNGDVTVQTNGSVKVRPAANNDAKARAGNQTEFEIGKEMGDGSMFAGASPDTDRAVYTMPADAPLTMKWKQAMGYAASLDAHGHKDWRVPTKGELNVLFKNRAAIGGFDLSGSNTEGWYWSSSQGYKGCSLTAWNRRFSDGHQLNDFKDYQWSVRCVR